MTARQTFEASVLAAGKTQSTTLIALELTAQETINQSGANIGYNPMNATSGANATYAAAVKSAAAATLATQIAAEQAKQASLSLARDTLRTTGDVGPV